VAAPGFARTARRGGAFHNVSLENSCGISIKIKLQKFVSILNKCEAGNYNRLLSIFAPLEKMAMGFIALLKD
jgi:hypothetical protein